MSVQCTLPGTMSESTLVMTLTISELTNVLPVALRLLSAIVVNTSRTRAVLAP